MRRVISALMTCAAWTCTAAYAADKPEFGPIPAWVKPVTAPRPTTPAGEAPFRVLLTDQQVDLQTGKTTVYSETALKIDNPQGLAAGNITFAWRPETDTPIIHKLLIRRGDQVIDVLASGQTFTVVRREQNLESAMLDGVLTATLQPEGLQVGDTIEFATTIASSDPTLNGHAEFIGAGWNFPLGRAHLRVQWPATMPVRWRPVGKLPAVKPVKAGGLVAVDMAIDDVTPIVPPKGAPPRYAIARLFEVTDYASWADLGALMAPLYEKAAVLPADGPLRAEAERIRAALSDPKARAEAALALVQDRIRYVALTMGTGGYVPADAAQTWSRRFGDCKGKTALLMALLRSLDIEAVPVVVSTIFGDGLDTRLPLVTLFNHVLVRATIGGKTYWLDGTRNGDKSLDRLTVPAYGWGLPLIATNAALVRMVPAPLETPNEETAIHIDASGGLTAPAPFKAETILRGDMALSASAGLSALIGDTRDRALRDYWKNRFDFVEIKSVTAQFDAAAGEQRLVMSGDARMDWKGGSYETDETALGWKADFARDAGPGHDAPFAVSFPYYQRVKQTIALPKDRGEFSIGPGTEVDKTVAGIHYRRHAAITGNVFTIERNERSLAPEFPASESTAAQALLRELADKSATVIQPSNFLATEKDVAAARSDQLTTSIEYLERARLLFQHGSTAEALADSDKAVELDPQNAGAWAQRALVRTGTRDLAGANSDLAKARSLDPSQRTIDLVQGYLAIADDRPSDAVAALTRAIEKDAKDPYALVQRGGAYSLMGDSARSLADASAAIRIDPKYAPAYTLRSYVYLQKQDQARAKIEAETGVAVAPGDPEAQATLGRVLLTGEDRAGARAAFTRAIAIRPQAEYYAERSNTYGPDEKEGRAADVDAALKLAPKSVVVLAAKAELETSRGDVKSMIAAWSDVIAASPKKGVSLLKRADIYWRSGDADRALADANAALAENPRLTDGYLLRANINRRLGKVEEALAQAAAVEAAVPEEVHSHVVAARIYSAFKKDADAFKAFDRALAIEPQAYIYLNRSYTRPKADKAGKRADIEMALSLDPDLTEAVFAKGELQRSEKDFAGAIATFSAALERRPEDMSMLVERGIAYDQSGEKANAEKDFTRARGMTKISGWLNNMCWKKATAGVALDSALLDCNAALAAEPGSAPILDSRGFVLLRLGRLDDAIRDYDKALAKNARLAPSLFGRAVAWSRKGDKARSAVDLAASEEIDADVRKDFENYGVTLD